MSSTSICSTTNASTAIVKTDDSINSTNRNKPKINEFNEKLGVNKTHPMKIKSEHSTETGVNAKTTNADSNKCNSKIDDSGGGNGMSCVYNSESPTGKTILITNYSHNGKSANCSLNINNALNKQKSSITIYTHKGDTENINSLPALSINILINNHYENNDGADGKHSKQSPDKNRNDFKLDSQPALTPSKIKVERIVPESTTDAQKDDNESVSVENVEETTESTTFAINEEVLVRKNDDRLYLGTIGEIRNDSYLVKFNCGSVRWSKLNELSKLSSLDDPPKCVVCRDSDGNKSAPVRICKTCQRGYHEQCTTFRKHSENPTSWCCHICTTTKRTNNTGKSGTATADAAANKFPYDLEALTWDTHHRQNIQQIYCYCGKRGKWFMQMLQCARCMQWFHAKCVKCLNFPLYFGDRFYLFSCANCNHGVEFLRRFNMNIEDVVHLLLFNLTLHFSKRYYNLTNVIFPYARDNWHALQLPPKLKNMISSDVKDEIIKALRTHTDRFKPGQEIKKKVVCWALMSRSPPKAPTIILPPGPLLTEKYINDLFYEQARINFLPQHLQNLSETSFSDAKIKDLMFGKNVASYINNNDASENTTSSDDMESGENVFTSASDEDILADLIVKEKFKNSSLNESEGDNFGAAAATNFDDSFEGPEAVGANESVSKNRKRGRPRNSQHDKSNDASMDFNYSSDDTSSRGTLDSIIPPPKNFSGINNPFLADINLPSTSNITLFGPSKPNLLKPPANNENILPTTSTGKSTVQLVRTVKRRLSAQDLIIGPNMEVKRRKLKKRTENVEVISTSSLADLPKSAAYLPLSADSKRISMATLRSTLKDGANSATKTPLKSTDAIDASAANEADETKNSNLIGSIKSSPIKDSIKEESIADLQSSLNMYFGGVTNRIENGERFVIKGKRVLLDGRSQYLIEWDGVS